MTQAFYRKWRPQVWDEVIGQQHVVQTLRNAVAAGKQGHAYLFAGPRGTGKTTVARILAKAVNCLEEVQAARPCNQCAHCLAVNAGNFLDLIEIDAASNTSVEDVRDLRDKINFSPNQGRYKVYLIDEVHMLSTAAFNALLKTLEEPPPHAIFVLATTEVHKIPATVLSRCQRHEFRRIPVAEMMGYLELMAKNEGVQIEPEALQLVARQATGSLRDAVSLLDQLSTLGDKITLDSAQTVLGTATSQAVLDMVDAILAGEAAKGLDTLHASLDAGSDPRQFARQMVEYLRGVMLVKLGNADQVDTTSEARQAMARHAQGFDGAAILGSIRAFNQAALEARGTWQPALPLELAFVEVLSQPLETLAAPPGTPPRQSQPQSKPPAAKAQNPARKSSAQTRAEDPRWEQVMQALKKFSPNTTGLLNSSSCNHTWEGEVIDLYFGGDVLKEKMEARNHTDALKQAAKQVSGVVVEVRCHLSGGKGALPPGVDSAGRVAAAMRLGGEIVDINELNPGTTAEQEEPGA